MTTILDQRLDGGMPEMKTLRFRIGHLMVLIASVAAVLGLLAPELRAWDRNARLIFLLIGCLTTLFLVCFSPVWFILVYLRRRSRRGLAIRAVDYAAVVVAIASGLGILAAITFAVRAIVVR